MSVLKWDEVGKRRYETGTDRAVLYPMAASGEYEKGVAWSGLTAYNESPSGAEASDLYADNIKYLTLRSAEQFGFTVEAYSAPEEWEACDGTAELSAGVTVGQQNRKKFGFCVRTLLGNDTENTDYGYKLHIVYNSSASPSERSYASVNDSPEAITFSWECTSLPVDMPNGLKPAASIVIDSTKVDADKLKELEDMLYGTESSEAKLPSPAEILEIFATA